MSASTGPTVSTTSSLPNSPTLLVPPPTSSRSSSLAPPPSPYPVNVDPSPVDSTNSNDTEGTEIDEDSQEDAMDVIVREGDTRPKATDLLKLTRINTGDSIRSRASSDEAPRSVIRLTPGSVEFHKLASSTFDPRHAIASGRGERRVRAATTPGSVLESRDEYMLRTSRLHTDLPLSSDTNRPTPRAQTRGEVEEAERACSLVRSNLQDESRSKDLGHSKSFEGQYGVDHTHETAPSSLSQTLHPLDRLESELAALRSALVECWTLCNTLANLSSRHRRQVFVLSASNGAQEYAWQSCWRLCQRLYHEIYEPASDAQHTLELCREFCLALFDVRQRGDEASDSVLRVSFEMNNHLYNTQDQHLPQHFQARTFDFYVTLCHRMMKQRTILDHETDALLRACWSLAENLSNLRQISQEAKNHDEESLGSAVQACWELCDLFRKGRTRIRPDKTTLSPGQPEYPNNLRVSDGAPGCSSTRPASSLSSSIYHDATLLIPPETPMTIIDDTASTSSSPESVNVPNILILGPAADRGASSRGTHHDRWSSNASIFSEYTESVSSRRTSSTATTSSEESHLVRLQYLLLKAAMSAGFPRASSQSTVLFVQSLPADAFGPLLWQKQLFERYSSLLEADSSLRALDKLPSKRLTVREVAKAVTWLCREEKWMWIRDLFRLVFEIGADEAMLSGNSIQFQI